MNDSIINSASHLKYLGVIIDSKLNWSPHSCSMKDEIVCLFTFSENLFVLSHVFSIQ